MARRTSEGAVKAAFAERDIALLYEHCDPRLIGWTADEQPVWEITWPFDAGPLRFPITELGLLMLAAGESKRIDPALFCPRLVRRAEGYALPPEPGWKYLACPTYERPTLAGVEG